MNAKLFFSCLMITFGMIFWMFFQPGSLTFIGIRVAIAFVSIILVFFSLTWNEKGRWKYTALILLVVLGLGTLGYLAFNYGVLNYPRITLFVVLILVVAILMYIKYLEPKILKRKDIPTINESEEEFDNLYPGPQYQSSFYDEKGNRMKMS